MSTPARILVVDDTPANVKLLSDLLTFKGYSVITAATGEEGLKKVTQFCPDLVLLDIMMPGMNGYEVCRAIRADPVNGILPVVMVTSLDPAQERIKGIEAGADDFLTKPVNQAELLARVKSLLRVKSLYDELERSKAELAEWNRNLEQRVAEGVRELERLGRMKRFVSPHVADLILSAGPEGALRNHRREIAVVFVDLRGFTAFTETADPEEVMGVLAEYHAAMGKLIIEHHGTLDRFAGDGIMVFFNDPVEIENPALQAVRVALAMQQRFTELNTAWKKRGYALHMGVGIAQGYATIGVIGFEGRQDYSAIGTVCNLAARLCAEAKPGQILVSQRVLGLIEEQVKAESVGELELKGFHRPVATYSILGLAAPV